MTEYVFTFRTGTSRHDWHTYRGTIKASGLIEAAKIATSRANYRYGIVTSLVLKESE